PRLAIAMVASRERRLGVAGAHAHHHLAVRRRVHGAVVPAIGRHAIALADRARPLACRRRVHAGMRTGAVRPRPGDDGGLPHDPRPARARVRHDLDDAALDAAVADIAAARAATRPSARDASASEYWLADLDGCR